MTWDFNLVRDVSKTCSNRASLLAGTQKKPMLTYYITRTVRRYLRKEARWFWDRRNNAFCSTYTDSIAHIEGNMVVHKLRVPIRPFWTSQNFPASPELDLCRLQIPSPSACPDLVADRKSTSSPHCQAADYQRQHLHWQHSRTHTQQICPYARRYTLQVSGIE